MENTRNSSRQDFRNVRVIYGPDCKAAYHLIRDLADCDCYGGGDAKGVILPDLAAWQDSLGGGTGLLQRGIHASPFWSQKLSIFSKGARMTGAPCSPHAPHSLRFRGGSWSRRDAAAIDDWMVPNCQIVSGSLSLSRQSLDDTVYDHCVTMLCLTPLAFPIAVCHDIVTNRDSTRIMVWVSLAKREATRRNG